MKKIIFFLVLFSACKSGDDNNAKPDTVSPNVVFVKTWNNLSGDIHVTTDNLVEGTTNKYFKTTTKVPWSQVYAYPIFATKGSADSLGWQIKNSNIDWKRITNQPAFATKSSVDSLAAKVGNGNGGISYTKDESNQIFLFRSEYIPGVSKAYTDSVITANKGNVDLSPYITKVDANALFATYANVYLLQSNVAMLQGTVTTLQNGVTSLQSTIAAQKTWIDSVKANTLLDNMVTLTDAPTISWNVMQGTSATVKLTATRTLAMQNRPTSTTRATYFSIWIYQPSGSTFDMVIPTGDKLPQGVSGSTMPLNHGGITLATVAVKNGVGFWNYQYY